MSQIMISAKDDNDTTAAYHAGVTIKHLLLARLYVSKFIDNNIDKHITRVNSEFELMNKSMRILIQNFKIL